MPTNLSPRSQTSAIVLTSTGSAAQVAQACPFGVYTGSYQFLSGASLQVNYVYKKLGGDVIDIELTPGNVYAAYEEAVLEYSYIVNLHQGKNVLSSILGSQNYMNGSETRLQQIDNEWELNTSAKMSTSDPNMHALMTDGTYTMPTVIPSGVYTKSAEIGIEVSSSLPNELSAIDAYFTSHISVFGIHIVGTSRVDNDKLLHSAYVLAEYLDNNQDGTVDDPNILEEMLNKNCVLTVTYDSDEIESIRSSVD